ncbi:MAG: hydratase, partial [Clostridia bacterium]|nr:hydratase [Clostridia bacterium]
CRTYDINYPDVIAINLTGKPRKGVGPQDVALAIIGAVFKEGFVKNKIMEFVGEGITNLPIEYRNGIDVMTTETTCLSSIWTTDNAVRNYFVNHGRPDDYKELKPCDIAMYDGVVEVDLSKVEPKIALPFHPSNVYNLADVIANPYDIFAKVEAEGNKLLSANKVKFNLLDKITKDGKVQVQQGIIAGCAGGTYDNIIEASNIIANKYIGKNEFTMSVYPSSQPIYYDLMNKGAIAKLVKAGVNIKTSFCGPCFGAGDVPANNALSIRHTTRNFESREGSKPANGQISSVALMDARSIATTAMNGGILTSALDYDYDNTIPEFCYDSSIYENRCYNGIAKPTNQDLVYGPNIKDWPEVIHLTDNIMLKMTAVINDPVTTTDELIPSGETSSYRSNPLKLAEFALSRKVPDYVPRAKAVYSDELARREENKLPAEYEKALKTAKIEPEGSVSIASVIYATKPGDGSAREQAASCQRVLGGAGNIAREYATKRYRSNLINWGMIPFISENDNFEVDDILYIPNVKAGIESGAKEFKAIVINGNKVRETILKVDSLTDSEKDIIVSGCLMNYYRDRK